MTDFTLHDINTAPADSRPLLEASQKAFGMIPNLHAVMAEAPGLLEGYQKLHALATDSSFNADELTVVWQTINVEHACHYCVPAHTGIAKSMKVDDAITDALRNQTPLPTSHLETLRDFTLKMVRERGNVGAADVQAFIDAGFTKRHVLEIGFGPGPKSDEQLRQSPCRNADR